MSYLAQLRVAYTDVPAFGFPPPPLSVIYAAGLPQFRTAYVEEEGEEIEEGVIGGGGVFVAPA